MIILDSCYTVSVIFVIVNICLLYLVLGLGLGLGREMILTTSHKVSAARSQGRPSATHQNKNAHTANPSIAFQYYQPLHFYQ